MSPIDKDVVALNHPDVVFEHVPEFDDPVRFQEHLKIDLGLTRNINFPTFLESKRQAMAYSDRSLGPILSTLERTKGNPPVASVAIKSLEAQGHENILDNIDRSYFLRPEGHRDAEHERVRHLLSSMVCEALTPPEYPFPKGQEEETNSTLDTTWSTPTIHYPDYWNKKITDKRVKKAILRRMLEKSVKGISISLVGAWLIYYSEIKKEGATNQHIDRGFEEWLRFSGDIFLFDRSFLSRFTPEQVAGFVSWWAERNKGLSAFNHLESALWKHFRDIFNYQGDITVFPKVLQEKIQALVARPDPARQACSGVRGQVETAGALNVKPKSIYEPRKNLTFQRLGTGTHQEEIALEDGEVRLFVTGIQKRLNQLSLADIKLAVVGSPETKAIKIKKEKLRQALQVVSYTGIESESENHAYESLPEPKGQMLSFANDRFSFHLRPKEADCVMVEFGYGGRHVACLYDQFSNLAFPADFFNLTAEQVEAGERPEIKNVRWLKKVTPEEIGMELLMREEPKKEPSKAPEKVEKVYPATITASRREKEVSLNLPHFWPPRTCLHIAIWHKSRKGGIIDREHKCFASPSELLPFLVEGDRYEIQAVLSTQRIPYSKATFPEKVAERVNFPAPKDRRRQKPNAKSFKPPVDTKPMGSKPTDKKEKSEGPDWGLVELATLEAVTSQLLSGNRAEFAIDLELLSEYLPKGEAFEPQVLCLVSEEGIEIINFLGRSDYIFTDESVAEWFRDMSKALVEQEETRIAKEAAEERRREAEEREKAKLEIRKKTTEAVMALGAFPKELEEAEGLFSASEGGERTFTYKGKIYYLWQKGCPDRVLLDLNRFLKEKGFGIELMKGLPLQKVKITCGNASALFDVASSAHPETMAIESTASVEQIAQMRLALRLSISYLFRHFISTDKQKEGELKKRQRESKGATERLLSQAENGTLSFSRGFNYPERVTDCSWESLALLDIDDPLLAARGAIAFARQKGSPIKFSAEAYEDLWKIVKNGDGFFIQCLIERLLDTFEEGDPEKKPIGNQKAVRIVVENMFKAGLTDRDLRELLDEPNMTRDFWELVFKDWQDNKVPIELVEPLQRTVGDLMTAKRRKG